jgi:GNAT superfamily N-acetyltransferase
MIQRAIADYEGPRTPREDERDATLRLTRSVFFPNDADAARAMNAWPMTRHHDQRENVFVMLRDGEPVSSIMRLERDCLIRGHRLRVGYVGAVCTHPAHRGKGLASALLEATFQRFRENHCDFAYISGTRPLYFGAGADHAAPATRYVLKDGTRLLDGPNVSVRPATVADVDVLVELALGESTRFVRRPDDYRFVLEAGYCAGNPATAYIVEFRGVPSAYLLCRNADVPRRMGLFEFAGDRACVYAALNRLSQTLDETGLLDVDTPHGDSLGTLLSASGVARAPRRDPGTIKALDPVATLRRLVPYFRERLADCRDLDLRLSSDGERIVAWCDDGSIQVDGERNALRLLLGASPETPVTGVRAAGALRVLIERCLPLPMPSFDLNMI